MSALLEQFEKRCRFWAERYGVSYYNLNFVEDSELEGTAEVTTWPEYGEAYVTVNPTELADEDVDKIARHEMVHIALAPYDKIVFDMMNRLPKGQGLVYAAWWRSVNERVTEHLARVLA